MADDANMKREGSVPLKGSRGKSKSKEIAIDDDMTLGAMKDEIFRKLAVSKSKGETSTAKASQSCSKVKIVEEEGLADMDLNRTSEGRRSVAKKINSGWLKILREEEGMETKPVMENKENIRIPLKRKRGADGELVLAYLSTPERSSSRLRPRKEVPSFRMVDLDENDDHRIVGKRVKVYWSDSRKWFTGNIKAFDDKKRLHSILYDDGDREKLDLRKERFELEIMPAEGFSLKVDSILKKKAGGLDVDEASKVISQEENFKVEYTDKVTKTPELKNEKSSKKVGKRGSLKSQRKFTKPKKPLAHEIHAAKELGELNFGEEIDESKPLAEIARKAAGKLEAKTSRLMASSEGEKKGSDNDDCEGSEKTESDDSLYITCGELVKRFGSLKKRTQGARNTKSSKLLSRKEANEVETPVADVVVDVCNVNEMKKSTVRGEINAEEAIKVNRQTTGLSRESQITTLDFNAKDVQIMLEDGIVSGDTEDKENLAKVENITASKDAAISLISGSHCIKDHAEDLPPGFEEFFLSNRVEEQRTEEMSVKESGDNGTTKQASA